jgi:hypothetical protein
MSIRSIGITLLILIAGQGVQAQPGAGARPTPQAPPAMVVPVQPNLWTQPTPQVPAQPAPQAVPQTIIPYSPAPVQTYPQYQMPYRPTNWQQGYPQQYLPYGQPQWGNPYARPYYPQTANPWYQSYPQAPQMRDRLWELPAVPRIDSLPNMRNQTEEPPFFPGVDLRNP